MIFILHAHAIQLPILYNPHPNLLIQYFLIDYFSLCFEVTLPTQEPHHNIGFCLFTLKLSDKKMLIQSLL
jgi:hypothetical protein